jgi:hypothetical protein
MSEPTYEQLLTFFIEVRQMTLDHDDINDIACVTADRLAGPLETVNKEWWNDEPRFNDFRHTEWDDVTFRVAMDRNQRTWTVKKYFDGHFEQVMARDLNNKEHAENLAKEWTKQEHT